MTTETMPEALRSRVHAFVDGCGLDLSSPHATRGQCEALSRGLAAVLDGIEVLDADGDLDYRVESWPVQLWLTVPAPDAIADDPMCAGHYVCRVEWDLDVWMIDLSAAQFPAMGWAGPRAWRE